MVQRRGKRRPWTPIAGEAAVGEHGGDCLIHDGDDAIGSSAHLLHLYLVLCLAVGTLVHVCVPGAVALRGVWLRGVAACVAAWRRRGAWGRAAARWRGTRAGRERPVPWLRCRFASRFADRRGRRALGSPTRCGPVRRSESAWPSSPAIAARLPAPDPIPIPSFANSTVLPSACFRRPVGLR